MSTKNVKIGLSKDNANQIIGAIATGVLNRLVTQFSTGVAYTKGQYTNYQNTLYRFTADKSAGAWDSTKVETASFNELVDDVNSAVASVTGKANTADLLDGTLVVSKALTAKDLENVSDESGTYQDSAFISQGTGTDNNTSSVDTGELAKQIEKQGNTVANNQAVDQAVNKSYTFTPTAYDGTKGYYTMISNLYSGDLIVGHKVLFYLKATLPANVEYLASSVGGGDTRLLATGSVYKIVTVANNTYKFLRAYTTTLDETTVNLTGCQIIDLTQYFNGNDNIPPDLLDHPDHWSWYDNGTGSYDAGSIKNASGRYLVCTHRQLWDEAWENGRFTANGNDTSGNGLRSKNYIPIVPNRMHYEKLGSYTGGTSMVICYYDASKTFISSEEKIGSTTFTPPANARYIRFAIYTSSAVSTYKNDTTISLYYSAEQGGEGYDQYYPYQEPSVYDTGNETLYACDKKVPSGEITRKTVRHTFTADDEFGWVSSTETYTKLSINSFNLTGKYSVANNNGVSIMSGGYMKDNSAYSGGNVKQFFIDSQYWRFNVPRINGTLADKSQLVGLTIEVEVGMYNEYTEQGTPFAENIEIDDYGMMYWLDTDGNLVDIPQGIKIFYPAWYAGYIDSLFARTEGDASDVVIQRELSAINSKIGAKLPECPADTDGTYTLKATVSDGEVTYAWVTDSE